DLARPGWAVLAVAGAVTAVAEAPSELPGNRRFYLRLAGWGVGALLSTLYSQEHGLCAFGAATLAVLAHRWWAVRATFVRRLLEVFRTAGAYIGGFAGGLLVWLLAYAAKGCAGLFLHTIWEMTRLEASGAWGFTPFPLRVASFDNAALLTDVPGVGGGYAGEFGAGPAVFL